MLWLYEIVTENQDSSVPIDRNDKTFSSIESRCRPFLTRHRLQTPCSFQIPRPMVIKVDTPIFRILYSHTNREKCPAYNENKMSALGLNRKYRISGILVNERHRLCTGLCGTKHITHISIKIEGIRGIELL